MDSTKEFIIRMQSYAIRQGWMHNEMHKILLRRMEWVLRIIHLLDLTLAVVSSIAAAINAADSYWSSIITVISVGMISFLVHQQSNQHLSSRISTHQDLMRNYTRFCDDIQIALQNANSSKTSLSPFLTWIVQDYRRLEDTARTVHIELKIEEAWEIEAKKKNIKNYDNISDIQDILVKSLDENTHDEEKSPPLKREKSPIVIRIDPRARTSMEFEFDRLSKNLQDTNI